MGFPELLVFGGGSGGEASDDAMGVDVVTREGLVEEVSRYIPTAAGRKAAHISYFLQNISRMMDSSKDLFFVTFLYVHLRFVSPFPFFS